MQAPKQETTPEIKSAEYNKPRSVSTIQDEAVNESSGLEASRQNPGIFWTHNDSGDDAFLYAFDKSGKRRGTFRVAGAKNVDWEDIAAYTDKNGTNFLFIADTGNNTRSRAELVIYRIREPQITDSAENSTKKNPVMTETADAIRISYPDMRRDAEALLINPANGDLYVVSKSFVGDAEIYKLSAPFQLDKANVLQQVGKIGVPSATPGLLTGGDVSPDGKRLVLCDYFGAYELLLPEKAKNFDEIWTQTPTVIDLGKREQGEAICYSTDGQSIFATSEDRPSPLIEVDRK